jgi:RNA polymerase sigma-70 factor (ECF subfamily)
METMVDEIPSPNRTASLQESVRQERVDSDGGDGGWSAIFEAIAQGEASGLHRLYDRSATRIYGLALWRTGSPDDASEVVQEVFVRVAEQGPRLTKVKNPKAWLLTVARRIAVDFTRRRKVRETEPLEDHPFLEAATADPGRTVDAERASAMLAGLPLKQRETIYLRHFAGCTFADIGRIVGVPTFTASSRYRLGVHRLRRLMEKER